MAAHRSTHVGGRRGRCRLPLTLVVVAVMSVLCALCAAAAPATATGPSATPGFTPFAATVTPPAITITSPTAAGSYAGGSLLLATWTTSPAAPAGGEFLVCLKSDTAQYSEQLVPSSGGADYARWLALTMPSTDVRVSVHVAWRPTPGTGAWLTSRDSPEIRVWTWELHTTLAGTHEQGSKVEVLVGVVGHPNFVGGDFGFWIRSPLGALYPAMTLPATVDNMVDRSMGSETYRATLTLNVPAGSGYQVVVAWRPNAGSFYGSWATGTDSFTVTADTADLTGLALSGSPAGYSFSPATYDYAGITVAHRVTSVTVTPTGKGTITVDGAVVASGQDSKAITLKDAGSPTTITVKVQEAGRTAKTYTLDVTRNDKAPDTPSFSPGSGAVTDNQKVTITADGAGQVFYTLDGSTPTRQSLLYVKGEPVRVRPPVTLRALAVRSGHDDSAVGAAVYSLAATPDLKELELSGDPSGYRFAPSRYAYAGVTVAKSTKYVRVTPKGTGTITVDGSAVKSGRASDRIALAESGAPTTITVVAKAAGKGEKTYTIAVARRVPGASAKDITAFSFTGFTATGVIAQEAGTIAVDLPKETDLDRLVARFTTTGASVGVGKKPQVSGVTSNDFTAPVTYTVTAADGSTRDYLVTVTANATLSAPVISPEGGKIASGTTVTITCPGATVIACTLDGSTPVLDSSRTAAQSGTKYSGPFKVWLHAGRPETIRAVAGAPGYPDSSVTTVTYTLADPLTITADAGAGGVISPAGARTVQYGASQTFTITPLEGHRIADVLVDGRSVGAVATYEFTDVKADHTIAASFAGEATTPSCTITPSAGVGGTISPGTVQTVRYGGAVEFTIAPSQGYRIADVLVDGRSVGAVATYRFTNVKADHTIVASFTRTTFTVTPTAGQGGTISPATAQTVASGGSVQFTMTASQGYHIADVRVDGSSAGPLSSYEFQNVTADHTIDAYFARDTHTVTPSAGPGGSITPDAPQTVDWGGSLTFTITPLSGYQVADVLVDGSSVGPMTSYQFQNVTADHTIAASFAGPAAITSFSFEGLTPAVPGFIDENARTISATVPFGTDVTALVPTITYTGTSLDPPGGVSHDFTGPVDYIAHAGVTEADYTVTVTVSPQLSIGESAFGGKVAYLLVDGDPGYSATVQHGLAVATENQGDGIVWALPDYQSIACSGALGLGIGDGAADTDAIIVQNGSGTGYAAGSARAYRGGGYADWYLPSKGELDQLFLNRAAIGIPTNAWYWSSSQSASYDDSAWGQVFNNGVQQQGYKNNTIAKVRAVRAF